ncbi:MAG TPA: DUF4215 domain-containing protein [Kofleriaceae bacterium]|nr:DUF4215 domain-containing protein [Kofleriaceae bacterium]
MGSWTVRVLVVLALVGCGDKAPSSMPDGNTPDAAVDAPDAAVTSSSCGNGVVEGTEQCDFGVDPAAGAGCEANCTFSCSGNSCDDGDLCNGAELCASVTVDGHDGMACTAGTAAAPGTSCGSGKICINNACATGQCGDSFTTAPEECDDANQLLGDGCENNCKFSCVSTDATRNCTPTDSCKGQGTCNNTTHTCSAGTPLADNTACGTGGYCKQGTCTQPVCGNSLVELGEACDHGSANGTANDGCKSNCQWVCTLATDCGTAPACKKEQCTVQHTCQAVADSTLNGMSCGGGGLVCSSGSCVSPAAVCGNGVVEAGEQCDFGSGMNTAGSGCEPSCQFSCTTSPNSCSDGNACNGTETCGGVTVNGKAGQKCSSGTALTDGSSCGTLRICRSQACTNSTCGDGYIDLLNGESCEPGNTATCDSQCRTILCGDGIRAGNEQCDDGNLTNLDGCNGTCKFEQVHRVNQLMIPFTGPYAFCTKNAMGESMVGSSVRTNITDAFRSGVTDGSIAVIFAFLGLDDLSGTSDASVSVAWIKGPPVTSTKTYNGNTDLDWWYTTNAADIDSARVPKTQMPGAIAAKVLTAGPAEVVVSASFSGVICYFDMVDAKVRVGINGASAPTVSTDDMTPGHIAAEHLNPALTSFESMGTVTRDTNGNITKLSGEVCGNTTAESLDGSAVPAVMLGSTPCAENYSASHTLLDVFVNGCKTFGLFTQVKGTQPDASRDGAKYTFQSDATRKIIGCTRCVGTTCVSSGSQGGPTLASCKYNAAYTSVFMITTDRVIAK